MQLYARSFLTAAVLMLSVGLWAQEVYHSNDPDLLARLSYDSSPIVQGDGIRQICLAVSRDGDYRIVRSVNGASGWQTVRLQGKIPKEQFGQLKTLLASSEFRSLSGNHGGLIRQESESFGAEIPTPDSQGKDSSQRFQWLNADGDSPFPAPVAKVVDWMKHFEPTDGKSFVKAEYPDVCPSGGLRLLQPSVAENGRP